VPAAARVVEARAQAGLAVPVGVEILARAEDPGWGAGPEAQVLAAWARVAREAPALLATHLTAAQTGDLVGRLASRDRGPHRAHRAKPEPARLTRGKCETTSPTTSGVSSAETVGALSYGKTLDAR
jgi:hypothetical protein